MGIFVMKNKTFHKKKILVVFLAAFILILYLIGRLVYLMVFDAEYYQQKAEDLHERERDIKAARGEIIDRNGTVLATNRTVCTISVIHSQIKEAFMHFFLRDIAATNSHTSHLVLGVNRHNFTGNRKIGSLMNFLHESLFRNRDYTTLSSPVSVMIAGCLLRLNKYGRWNLPSALRKNVPYECQGPVRASTSKHG